MTPADIKALRAKLGFTQEQLAQALHVSHMTVVRWEMGQRRPPWSTLELLRTWTASQSDKAPE